MAISPFTEHNAQSGPQQGRSIEQSRQRQGCRQTLTLGLLQACPSPVRNRSSDIFKLIVPPVYHNDGNRHFTEASKKGGLAKPGNGLGTAFADYDRHGRADIFVANDSVTEFTCHNRGDRAFEDSCIGIRRHRKHRLTGILYEFNFDTMCEVSWN
jgi:hypothetical protein